MAKNILRRKRTPAGYEPEWTEEEFANRNKIAGVQESLGPEPITEFGVNESLAPTKNVLTAKKPSPVPKTLATDSHSAMWGQKVGVGNTGIPLDVFAQTAGMIASSLDPAGRGQGFGGRLGEQMAKVGSDAYKMRMQREYEGPNRLLSRKLQEQQIQANKIAIEKARTEAPKIWDTVYNRYKKAGLNEEDAGIMAAQAYYAMQRTPTKENIYHTKIGDRVLVFKNGELFNEVKVTPEFEVKDIIETDKGGILLVGKGGEIRSGPAGKIIKRTGYTPQGATFENDAGQIIHRVNGKYYKVVSNQDPKTGIVRQDLVEATEDELKGIKNKEEGLFIDQVLSSLDQGEQVTSNRGSQGGQYTEDTAFYPYVSDELRHRVR